MIDVQERKCLIEQIEVLKKENVKFAKDNSSLKEQLRYKLQKNTDLLCSIGMYFIDHFTNKNFDVKMVIRWIDEFQHRNENILFIKSVVAKNTHKIDINKQIIKEYENYLINGDNEFKHAY